MRTTTRRGFLRWAGAGLLGAGAMLRAAAGAASAPKRPNIVFILIDDLGWADLGCYGSTYHRSPIVDRLAAQGMRFTDAYAACPVCSPTRVSILTGKYPARVGVTDFIPGHYRPFAKLTVPTIHNQLPLEETTIPEALKRAGYVSACFGKWHLGGGQQFGPKAQGFDVADGGNNRQRDKMVENLTDLAVGFIEENRDKPFFLYLSHNSVHIALEAPPELVDAAKKRLKPGQEHPRQANPTYAAMIEHLDKHVGRVLDKLDELKLAERTMVVFYSDNGGLIRIYTGQGEIVTSNLPARSEKGTLYEGGIRVPLIVRWPGVVRPGSVSHEVVTSTDFFPTFVELAGLRPQPGEGTDGVSLMPVLKGGRLDRDAIYWHYPHYHHCAPCAAVRAGNYKLIEYFEDGKLELYDLSKDLGEKHDLSADLPAKAAELQTQLAAWRNQVGALMPTSNPNHDPTRAPEWGRRPRPGAKTPKKAKK
ncbi:MAG TPA: sulfatase [Phycisphaerae bacterium]|nr:sulfatase [Phycisphaerae bacterium]